MMWMCLISPHVPLSFSTVEATFFLLATWQMAEDGRLWQSIEETVTMNLQQKNLWAKAVQQQKCSARPDGEVTQ